MVVSFHVAVAMFRAGRRDCLNLGQFKDPCVLAMQSEQWCMKAHACQVHVPCWNLKQKRGELLCVF